jgi:uncharacterized membrane protein
MDRLAHFLFKHERAVFTNGRLSFDARPSLALIIAGAVLAGLFIYYLYIHHPRVRLSRAWLAGLIGLRVALFALLALLLMRPVIIVPSVIPRSTYVAVLADDSRSMQLMDAGDTSRLDAIKNLLAPQTGFRRRLEDKFKTMLYGFSGNVTRLQDVAELSGTGTTTDLAGALRDAVRQSTGVPLSAIILFSDGAANTPRDLSAQLRQLRAHNLPVFTVGVGSPQKFRDAELVQVTVPRQVIIGSAVIAEAQVRLNGYDPTRLLLAVSEDGRALRTEEFEVRGNETQTLELDFTPATAGDHRYTFTITPLEGELTVENNTQETLVHVTDKQAKVLYIEGEPRWEYGKMRASLSRNEKNVALVSVLRSANGKFYRQGISNERELMAGFPQTEEELFSYEGLILGSIEANFFTFDQLRSIEQFVARRGGGFLAIGGRYAFGGGKYASTPIADLLPLNLKDRAEATDANAVANFKAALTARGRTHPIARLAEGSAQSAKAWEELPPITVPEILSGIKPGASVLLEARSLANRNLSVPLLAEERYGRGRTLALTASDTWRWRMEMDSKNTSHENFWRQMVRYLVTATPGRIEVLSERDVYAPGEPVRIRAEVNDRKYEPVKDAKTALRVLRPSGESIEVPLKFIADNDANIYAGEFTPHETGLYRLELNAAAGPNSGTAQSSFYVTEINREFFDAAQNVDLLKRIAAETGGHYYPIERASEMIDDLTYRDTGNSERVTKELWDMPINFFILIGLASAEWFLRKKKGLA